MGSKHQLLVGGVGTVIVSAGLVAAMFFHQLNAPATGVIDSSTTVTPVKSFDLTPRLMTGKQATFQYPASLQVKPANPSSEPELEQFNFAYKDTQSWILSISVSRLNSGRLADISSLQFRRTRPDIYKESTLTLGSRDITLMTDVTAPGFAKVGYLFRGTRSASVSLVGDSILGTDNLDKSFRLILATWSWQ
jgi:hypothetical protein